jgi:hypothetical protein
METSAGAGNRSGGLAFDEPAFELELGYGVSDILTRSRG